MATKTICLRTQFPTIFYTNMFHLIYAFVVIIFLSMATFANAQECPSRCNRCQNGVADCKTRSLTAPPKSYPPDTRIINLQGNHIRILGSRTFRRGQTAEILKVGGNIVTALRNDAFRTFPNLMTLDLNGNRISRVYPRALAGMSRLRTLSLNRNRIRRLTGIFQGTPNLHQLNLASNRIVNVGENDFSSLTRIHYLDLRDNNINRIHSRAFKQMMNLRYLFLNNNPIGRPLNLEFITTVLQLVDISNCRLPKVPKTLPVSVTDLRLGRNKIMQINHTDFQDINDLQMMALNDNELHFLADGTFTHLTQLKEIWLRGNNLVYVPRDIPANVEKLYMDSNRIQEIETGLFSADSGLEFFSAENNKIRRINPETFNGMNQLEVINLQGNEIQILESNTFSNLENLHTILLSNNPLQRIEAGVFQNLPNLTHLHLSYLSTETMEILGNFLPAMPNLQTLQLMASPGLAQATMDMVDSAGENDFVILPNLHTIDLSFNNLRRVSPRFNIMFPNVRSLILENNPFHCTQELRWLKDWMGSSDIIFHRSDELACQSPESLRGRTLQSLTEQEWTHGGVISQGGQNQHVHSGRSRSKRRHDEASYREVHRNNNGGQDVRKDNNQVVDRSRSAHPAQSRSSQEMAQTSRETVARAMARRADREERLRNMRHRSRSRSRSRGRKRGKGRRRKERKSRRRNGGKKRNRKSRVKRENEA